MLCLLSFCSIWLLHVVPVHCHENSTGLWLSSLPVFRVLVPEDHHVCLRCGGFHGSDVVWTHQDRELRDEGQRHRVVSDGLLCVLQLDESDSGQYCCDGQLAAELQVLAGSSFVVYAGWTLLLPCSQPYKPKQRWFHRRRGGRREPIFTLFRNGTVRPERGGDRMSFENDALQIQDLQPDDAGEYQCGEMQVRVAVVKVLPDPTSVSASSATMSPSVVMEMDDVDIKKKDQRRLNALLLVAVGGLGVTILLLAGVCVLLASMRCRSTRPGGRRAVRREDTELQSWTTSGRQTEYEEVESHSIHYASLGRHNWGERANRPPPPGQNRHGVIYSSVITRS